MASREKLIEIFEDTMKWINENAALSSAVKNTISGTKLYMEDEYPEIGLEKKFRTTINVSRSKSFEAALRLRESYKNERIAVHNFASATNPGGGVTSGARAQEESLCRCSTLYPALKTSYLWENYYLFHRKRHDVRYTDACIYTPDVCIVRDDTDNNERLPENEWCKVDILTCAAPNLRLNPINRMNPGTGNAITLTSDELFELHKKRAEHLLSVAAANGVEVLVLGAFGCGAFQNDPEIVANAYKEVIGQFDGVFKHIEFAVFCTERESGNYTAFRDVFE